MATWRDAASPEAQQDLDGLLPPALGFAQEQLSRHGEYFPHAFVLRTDMQVEMVMARPTSGDDHPTSADVIASCRTTLAERRDRLRATAIVADVRMPDGSGAIRVELEHNEGIALTVQLPYTKRRLGRGIEYQPLQAGVGSRHVWLD